MFTVYEYSDAEDSEPDDNGSGEGVTEEVNDDVDDIATSDDESVDEDDDGIRRDWSDDDEPSW